MCEVYEHSNLLTQVEVNKYDPTHTTTLRNTMVSEGNRRFNEIARLVRKAVDDEDCFGLKTPTHTLLETPGRNDFAFATDEQKIIDFLLWLNEQIKKGLITYEDIQEVGQAIYPLWTNKFIRQAYERGVSRAQSELRKAGYTLPEAVVGIGLISGAVHTERIGLLYARVYNELKGITSAMIQQIGRVLAKGLMQDDPPRVLARMLVAVITGEGVSELGLTDTLGRFIPARRRAEIMARTEIIRAHHLGSVQEYRNWGVEGVKVLVEWVTAGDQRVCPLCASLGGSVFTLDEIEGMIPIHAQCRCTAIPLSKSTTGKN